MNIVENACIHVEVGLLKLTERYQFKVMKNGKVPNTSEVFRKTLIKSGLGGALQSYLSICVLTGQNQTTTLKEHYYKGRNISSKLENLINLSFATLYATVIGPVQTTAVLFGKSEKIEQLNSAMGDADWTMFPPPGKRDAISVTEAILFPQWDSDRWVPKPHSDYDPDPGNFKSYT